LQERESYMWRLKVAHTSVAAEPSKKEASLWDNLAGGIIVEKKKKMQIGT